MVFDLALFYAVGDFVVQTLAGANDCDFGIGDEEFDYATCCYLEVGQKMSDVYCYNSG